MTQHYYGFYSDSDTEELKDVLEIDEYLDMKYGHNANSKSEERWIDNFDDITEEEMEEFRALQDDPEHQIYILGMQLHDERKALGMSQQYVSKEIGVSIDTISRLEKGHTNFRKDTVAKIKRFLWIEDDE